MFMKAARRQATAVILSFLVLFSSFAYTGSGHQRVYATDSGVNLVANAGFEQDESVTASPTNWQTVTSAGAVTTQLGGHNGEYSARITTPSRSGTFENPAVGIYQLHTGLEQGTYTLSAWVRTSSPNPSSASQQKTAYLEAKGTGAPEMRAFINLFANNSTDWNHVVLRNVIVYNGQATIGIYLQDAAGGLTVEVDDVAFYMEHSDNNPLVNWGFESGNTNGWTQSGEVSVVTDQVDAGQYAARLSLGARIEQTVAVEPNTDYIATVRAKVGADNERVRIGAAGVEEARSAPSATTDYTLLPVAFRTGPSEHTATIYVERTGDGTGYGYVDSINLFEIDQSVVKGVDVSYLLIVEDYGGKYKANGVEQDFFDIIRNHGVNAVMSMIFVEAGNYVYEEQEWKDYHAGLRDDLPFQGYNVVYRGDLEHLGTVYGPLQMPPGYFGKEQALEIGKRAKKHNMNFEVSFHYSDTWMSSGKAWKPLSWFGQDIQQLQTTMYNYTYDFIKTLADEGVAPHSVKLGNEQNSGIVWPEGKISSWTREGFAKLVNASYQAMKDASPTARGYLHLNNGFLVPYTNDWYTVNEANNMEWDGTAYSLYGGRETGSIIDMLNNNFNRWKGNDVIFSETGLAHTTVRYSPILASGSMGNKYYETSQRGQYNWLIEYMQAFRDVPNAHNSEIGFYYWAAEWLSKGDGHDEWFSPWIPGGSTSEYGNVADNRTLFTYDGHMSDGMYAYLWRGKAISKPMTGKLSHINVPAYSVEPTSVTGVELDEEPLELAVGKSGQIVPTIQPIDRFTYSSVTWSSSDTEIAKVNGQGIVTAISPGTAAITVTTVDGGYTATRDVEVTAATLATGLTIQTPDLSGGDEISAIVGDRIRINAKLDNIPTDHRLIFTSSQPDIATFLGEAAETANLGELIQQPGITDDVTLLVHQEGQAEITISSADGNVERTIVLNASKIPVASVQIQAIDTELGIGRTRQLRADVLPSDASFPGIEWTTNNTQIATVDANGLVTGVTAGEATITAFSVDSGETDSVTITVVPVKSETIQLDVGFIRLRAGESQTLAATVLPLDTFDKTLQWTSSNADVFTVNNGHVTAIADGEAELTVTAADGGANVTISVIVADELPVVGVNLDRSELSLTAGRYEQLQATIIPLSADIKDVIWSSSDESIASVTEDGYVIAHKAGIATITVETVDGGYTAEAEATVSDELQVGRSEATGTSRERSGNMPPAAVDGNLNTAWSPGASNTLPASWWIDLGQRAEINEIEMEFWGVQKYEIEVSDNGTAYTQVVDNTQQFSPTKLVSHTLPEGTMGRYVRVTVREVSQAGGTTWPSIVDFAARGKFAPQPDALVLSDTTKSIVMTDSLELSAALQPSFIQEEITWQSSDSALAEVIGSGSSVIVTTNGHNGEAGEFRQAVITATTASGLSASATIGIKAPIIVEDVYLYRKDQVDIPSDGRVTIQAGQTLELGVSVFQSDSDYRQPYWTSADSTVASVDEQTGVVTAHEPGIATITLFVDSYSNIPGGFLFTQEIELTVLSDVPTPTYPAPTGLQAGSATTNSLTLSWNEADAATGYNLYRATTADGVYVKVNATSVTESTYSDSGLHAGTTYYYKLSALYEENESELTAYVSATTISSGSGGNEGDNGNSGGGGTVAPEPETDAIEVKEDGTIVVPGEAQADGTWSVKVSPEAVSKAIEAAKSGTITIEAKPDPNAEGATIVIPVQAFKAHANVDHLAVKSGHVKVQFRIQANQGMVDEQSEQAEVKIHRVKESALPDVVKQQVKVDTVFDLAIAVDGQPVPSFGAGNPVTVEIDYTPRSGEKTHQLIVYHVKDNGELQVIRNSKYEQGVLKFQPEAGGRYAVAYVDISFNDLGEAAWAQNMVETLAARDVLQGVGNDSFAPSRTITRAEFLELLVNALNVKETASEQSGFADVGQDDWYFDAVSTAARLGIVNGRQDGTFGANDAISREDMAVMLSRAFERMGTDIDTSHAEHAFLDEERISSYAQEAVARLLATGIIEGFEDGSFRPQAMATRAQAAAIIYRLLNLE